MDIGVAQLHTTCLLGKMRRKWFMGSASQFKREYTRFFGQPPMRDIRTLRSPGARLMESVSNLQNAKFVLYELGR